MHATQEYVVNTRGISQTSHLLVEVGWCVTLSQHVCEVKSTVQAQVYDQVGHIFGEECYVGLKFSLAALVESWDDFQDGVLEQCAMSVPHVIGGPVDVQNCWYVSQRYFIHLTHDLKKYFNSETNSRLCFLKKIILHARQVDILNASVHVDQIELFFVCFKTMNQVQASFTLTCDTTDTSV